MEWNMSAWTLALFAWRQTTGKPEVPGPGQTLSYMSNEPSLGALTSLVHGTVDKTFFLERKAN